MTKRIFKHISIAAGLWMIILSPLIAFGVPPDKISYTIEVIGEQGLDVSAGDTVDFVIRAKQSGRICLDGVDRTKIYFKGMKMLNQKKWMEQESGIWIKSCSALVTGNASGKIQITAFRKTDQGTVIKTLALRLRN